MEVTCENCHTKLNIPDEKIPKDHAVRISCPKCKGKITINTGGVGQEESAAIESTDHGKAGDPQQKDLELKKPDEPEKEGYSYDDFSSDDALDTFEDDAKLALIMAGSPEDSEKINRAVVALGYTSVSSPDTRDALGKIRFHNFDLIILSDNFDGQDFEQSPILNHLNHISMSQRRRMFLALIGDQFKTMDNMMTFAMSANGVVNSKDVAQLEKILKRAISDNDKFYKVFMETLEAAGRA